MTNNTKNIEALYEVLTRDTIFVTNVIINHKIVPEENKQIFIECVEKYYPEEFKKAFDIVNDPNRKIVSVYVDEIQYYGKKYEQLEFDRQNLQDIIHAFLDDNEDIRPKFIEFLKEKKQEQDEGDIYWIDDIDWHILNFGSANE